MFYAPYEHPLQTLLTILGRRTRVFLSCASIYKDSRQDGNGNDDNDMNDKYKSRYYSISVHSLLDF